MLNQLLILFGPSIAGYLVGKNSEIESNNWYRNLNKSPLNPPGYIFGPVWFVLYLSIGWVLMIQYNQTKYSSSNELYLCIALTLLQLALNYSWSPVFFTHRNFNKALSLLFYMIVIQFIIMILLYNINRTCFYILLPYTLWLLFAYHLNYYIVTNN